MKLSFSLFSLLPTALVCAVELEEIYPTSSYLQKRDFALFDLKSAETFLWGQQTDSDAVLANFTVEMPGDAENILSMERFKGMLKSVECTDSSMTISFVDDESYRYAQKAWDWVNGVDNHSFVMVASKGDCGDNTYRLPYVVHDIAYDDSTVTANLNAEVAEWSDIAHTYHLRAGSLPIDTGLTGRDLGKKTTIPLNSDFRFKSKVKKGPVSLDLRCDPCYIQGSIGFEFNIVTKNWIPRDVQFKAAPNGVKAEAALTVIFGYAEAKASTPRVLLGQFPLPGGISIPGNILNLGPSLKVEYGADIAGQLAVSFGTGAIATIPDTALLQVDLLNPENNKHSSWTPHVEPHPAKFDADQFRANVKLTQFIELAVELGASVLKKGIAASLRLKMPYVETKAEFIAANLPGFCDKKPDGDVGIKITNNWGVELKFVAGKLPAKSGGKEDVEVSLAAGNYPLGAPICWAFDAPGSPKPSSSKAPPAASSKPPTPSSTKKPAATPSSKPDANSCKVGSYGSGKCLNKNTCMGNNKVPVPGYCPDDPVDVQCCVEYPGADTCTVGKKTGSCLSTTVCKSSDGVSTPNYCPNDPKGIQCCTSKLDPAPSGNGKKPLIS